MSWPSLFSLLWSLLELIPRRQGCLDSSWPALDCSVQCYCSFIPELSSVSINSQLPSLRMPHLYNLTNQISIYPSIHKLSSAMTKLHNLESAAEGACCAVYMQDTSLNREIHVNLVLTGVSCNDIGCVLPLLHVIFHLSQQAYSTTALPTHTRHLLYHATWHFSCRILLSTYLRYSVYSCHSFVAVLYI